MRWRTENWDEGDETNRRRAIATASMPERLMTEEEIITRSAEAFGPVQRLGPRWSAQQGRR